MNLKKLNRGLLLGAVLIIGTTCYVVYDNSKFNNSKPEIRETVENYFKNLSAVNTSGKDEIYDKAADYVNSSWTYEKSSDDNFYVTKDMLLNDIRSSKEDNSATGYITEYDVSVSNPTINKNGPNGAVVSLSVDTYSEFCGSPAALLMDGFIQVDNGNYDESDYLCDPDESKKYESTINYDTVYVYLKQVDGEWKITSIENYGYDENTQMIRGEDDYEGGADDGE